MSRALRGRRTVRISDVARAAGVSKTLVSYALNDRPGVKATTRAHIVGVARSMGWTPSLPARALSSSRAYAIGLVFDASPEALAADQYFTSLMAGLQSVLSTSRYSLVTEVVQTPESEIDAYRRLADEGRVDGMVLVDLHPGDPRLAHLEASGLAFVCLGHPPMETTMPVLVYDETQATADVVSHLVGLGHRSIAQVVGPQTGGPAILRRQLYQRMLREHHLDDSHWIESDYTAPGGRVATEVLMARWADTTAIIYPNDLMAIAGMATLFAQGLRIPEDLSIVGWDDITVAEYLHPPLSTVAQHPFEDGRVAATLLLQAIDGEHFSQPVSMPDPVFRPRGSTGRPRPGRRPRARAIAPDSSRKA
jgi:DNA-binding LacI/PurR family transcriptional regulator